MIQNAGLHSPLEKECLETICETVMTFQKRLAKEAPGKEIPA